MIWGYISDNYQDCGFSLQVDFVPAVYSIEYEYSPMPNRARLPSPFWQSALERCQPGPGMIQYTVASQDPQPRCAQSGADRLRAERRRSQAGLPHLNYTAAGEVRLSHAASALRALSVWLVSTEPGSRGCAREDRGFPRPNEGIQFTRHAVPGIIRRVCIKVLRRCDVGS